MYPNKPGQIWKFQYRVFDWDLTYPINSQDMKNGYYMFLFQETVGSSLYYKFYNIKRTDYLLITIDTFLREGSMWELFQDVN